MDGKKAETDKEKGRELTKNGKKDQERTAEKHLHPETLATTKPKENKMKKNHGNHSHKNENEEEEEDEKNEPTIVNTQSYPRTPISTKTNQRTLKKKIKTLH